MNAHVQYQVDPVVRMHLDFKLEDVPRFWFVAILFEPGSSMP